MKRNLDMAYKVSKNSSTQLENARIAINNTINDPEILKLVAEYGYTPARMEVGKSLYEQAVAAVNSKIASEGQKSNAYETKRDTRKKALITTQSLRKVCRAIFQNNPEKLISLNIQGKLPSKNDGFLAAAQVLFSNASLPEIADEIIQYGYTPERLATERAVITSFENAIDVAEKASADAQLATIDLKAAITKLKSWLMQYLKIARVALKDRAELLEKLGLRIYSYRTEAQRKAPQKAAQTRLQNKAALQTGDDDGNNE